MNVYEALAEMKSLKEKLGQLSDLRKESNSYDEGTVPEFRFDDLTKQMDEAFDRLTSLKLAVQAVNMSSKVRAGGEEMSLSKAILELSDARARLGYIAAMMQAEKRGFLGLDRDSDRAKKVLQMP